MAESSNKGIGAAHIGQRVEIKSRNKEGVLKGFSQSRTKAFVTVKYEADKIDRHGNSYTWTDHRLEEFPVEAVTLYEEPRRRPVLVEKGRAA